MTRKEIKTIDDVLLALEVIILEAEKNGHQSGYFAVLYQRVTQKVKEGIADNYFDDGPRMEELDVVFAKKYIDAYYGWKNNRKISQSWEKTFQFVELKWPVVLQHLLMGMNAHINLDLGIAAAEISRNKNIENLRADFFRINEVLSLLVSEVQNNLSLIWPPLKKILSKTGKLDNMITDFSMEAARDGAWNFARFLSTKKRNEFPAEIAVRDEKIMQKAHIISNPGFGIKVLIWIIRLGETGSVSQKIIKLKLKTEKTVTVPLQR